MLVFFCPYQAAVRANLLKQMSGIFTTPFPARPPYRKLIAPLKRRTCSTHREQEMWSLKAAVTQSQCQEHCIAGLQLQATHADGGPPCGSPTRWPERTHQSRNNCGGEGRGMKTDGHLAGQSRGSWMTWPSEVHSPSYIFSQSVSGLYLERQT